MNCAYCERPAQYQVRAGLQRLALCERCARAWSHRALGTPLADWLRLLKPAPKRYPQCPFCGTTATAIRETGLYGCALCYTLVNVE
ncbi:MAG: hypothetical protein NZ843_01850 [Fimbriimonadales bacterium]|nr:hypothetical protein [Fimbriimonadales bacterium]